MPEKNGRKRLDDWFPTLVRYAGVVLVFYAAIVRKGEDPALFLAAAGMIGFKTVYGSGPPKE